MTALQTKTAGWGDSLTPEEMRQVELGGQYGEEGNADMRPAMGKGALLGGVGLGLAGASYGSMFGKAKGYGLLGLGVGGVLGGLAGIREGAANTRARIGPMEDYISGARTFPLAKTAKVDAGELAGYAGAGAGLGALGAGAVSFHNNKLQTTASNIANKAIYYGDMIGSTANDIGRYTGAQLAITDGAAHQRLGELKAGLQDTLGSFRNKMEGLSKLPNDSFKENLRLISKRSVGKGLLAGAAVGAGAYGLSQLKKKPQ